MDGTHPFGCLAACDVNVLSHAYERDIVMNTGLGEIKVRFSNIECCAEQSLKAVLQVFLNWRL